MKILTAEQMRDVDRDAILNHGIKASTLMENAGSACADEILSRFGELGCDSAIIFTGKGNNGGDGFVIARQLHVAGWRVAVAVLSERDAISGESSENLDRLPADVSVTFFTEPESINAALSAISGYQVAVDAIFGTGLNTQVTGVYLRVIKALNESGIPLVSVDIPSGVHGTTGQILGEAVKADMTVTFATAKLGHVLYPGAEQTGELKVVDIGIPADLIMQAHGYEYINLVRAKGMIIPRPLVSHKGSFGHALIIAGSTGHTGAAALAGRAAVRSGAGLVTVAIPSSLNHILEIKLTEAMTFPIDDSGTGYLGIGSFDRFSAVIEGKDAVALGPGLSRNPATSKLVQKLVSSLSLPLIIDADGLNALSENISILERRESQLVILTPHPGEMARLTGLSVVEIEADRVGIARNFAVRYNVYLVLKGARTIIASPDGRIAVNGSGNPGMASGGMGDVLTGIISALICQGYDPFEATSLAVFIHGFSADIVASEKGFVGLTASDIIEKLPLAIKKVTEFNPD